MTRRDAIKPLLQGMKARDIGAGAWMRAFASRMLPREGVVTYSVVVETSASVGERRREARRPVHLQSGKILDGGERFLTEFLYKNRTQGGIRLRLAQRVPLPRSILLYDDQQGALLAANVIWQNGVDAGCRMKGRWPHNEKLILRMSGPYYSVQ
ncbi:hypothetical+protein [Methylocapsa aurea]|uniref:hypothetical protein n=1 Tax=Methylocapsa aurea TaxID=663610 RepID=UPI003D18D65B